MEGGLQKQEKNENTRRGHFGKIDKDKNKGAQGAFLEEKAGAGGPEGGDAPREGKCGQKKGHKKTKNETIPPSEKGATKMPRWEMKKGHTGKKGLREKKKKKYTAKTTAKKRRKKSPGKKGIGKTHA